MKISKKLKDEILHIITSIGSDGATIIAITQKSKFERHTISKYLKYMEKEKLIFHTKIGKAKLWHVYNAPLETFFETTTPKNSYSEKILTNIMKEIPLPLLIINDKLLIVYANINAKENYGSIEGKTIYNIIPNRMKMKLLLKLYPKQKIQKEKINYLQDKTGRHVEIHTSKIKNYENDYYYIIIIKDITHQILFEQQEFTNKQILEAERRALHNSVIIAETDLDGKITYANKAFTKISGYSNKELIGKTHKLVSSGQHSKNFYKNILRTLKKGKVWRGMIKNKTKDGRYYWLESAMAPVLDKKNKPIKYIAIRFDATKYNK